MAIVVKTDGLTEADGKSVKTNFEFTVTEEAVPLLLANECKVRARASYRKQIARAKDGDTIKIKFYVEGDKLKSELIDEKSERRQAILASIEAKAAELGVSVEELISKLI